MAEDGNAPETDKPIQPISDDDRWTAWEIFAFVICILIGLGILAWLYAPPRSKDVLCANIQALCGGE
jgi:hypothetical protein